MKSNVKKRKVVNEEADAIIASSVAELLEADRKFVSINWQKRKSNKQKTQKIPKQNPIESKHNSQDFRNGLQNWKKPESLFPIVEIKCWSDFNVESRILDSIKFPAPTDVQKYAIPTILDGYDLLIGAAPSNGKTLSYIIAILHKLTMQNPRLNRQDGTQVVVLCRDLAKCQANYELWTPFLKSSAWWLTCSVFGGGENRNHEKARLRKGVNIMITTESRLMDHLENTTSFKIESVKFFVIEELGELLKLKRGAKLRRANQLLQERVRSQNHTRMQNIILTSSLHQELTFSVLCMLQDPVSIGLNFKQEGGGTNKKWTTEVEKGVMINCDDH